MSYLDDTAREQVKTGVIGFLSDDRIPCDLLPNEFRTLVNEIDTWVGNNKTSLVQCLSEPGRSAGETIISLALCFVVLRRVSLKFLKALARRTG